MTAGSPRSRAGLVLAGTLGLAIVGVLGLVALIAADEGPPDGPGHRAKAARSDPPADYHARTSLDPPAGVERPTPPRTPPKPAALTPDDRRAMNYAVDDVVRLARTDCLEPWLARAAPGEESEFVVDAVLVDGRVLDIGIRSLDRAIPAEVLACVADRAWLADWPEWDLPGELRLQRAIAVTAGAP